MKMKKKHRGKQPRSSIKEGKETPVRSFDDLFHAAVDHLSVVRNTLSRIRNPRIVLSIVFLTIMTLAVLLPFAERAFHIDDPLFIWAAKHIQKWPLDPYGFQVNWYGTEQPMWRITKNPPLVSYYLAFVSMLTGWNEMGIHLAMSLFAVVAVLGIYTLSRKFCLRPLEATLASVLTPVFLVSSTTVMCDVAMLSFWIWAIVFWVDGMEKKKPVFLIIGSSLVAAAALTKYYGAALIPLLFAYSLMKERALGWWAIFLFIPVGVLAAYEWSTGLIYGHGLLREALIYPSITETYHGNKIETGAIGLAFTGGCLVTVLLYLFFLLDKKGMVLGGGVFLLILFLAAGSKTIGGWHVPQQSGVRWLFLAQFSLFVSSGFGLLVLTVQDLWTRRDEKAFMLFLWVFGTFVFAAFINWTVNARSILPMVPAAGMLLMRRFDTHFPSKKKWNPALALVPALVMAVLVTWADFSAANTGKTAAHIIRGKYGSSMESVRFQGHWGFQYYMELSGARPVDYRKPAVGMEGIIVVPKETYTNILPNPKFFTLEHEVVLQPFLWLTVMQRKLGAGFYSDLWGPCPFLFGTVPPERYDILSRQ